MDPLSAGMSLLQLGAGLFGQNQTNQMQQQMMQQQNSFQERMSSTAYQRATSDMTAAGLNPMMMFGHGAAASSPSGASPAAGVQSGINADNVGKALSTATQMRVADATINNLVEQNAKIKAETLTEQKRPMLLMENTLSARQQQNESRSRESINLSEKDNVENRAVTSRNEMGIPKAVRLVADQLGYGGKKVTEIMEPIGSMMHTAKGIKYLEMPSGRRSTVSRRGDGPQGGYSHFEERFHY